MRKNRIFRFFGSTVCVVFLSVTSLAAGEVKTETIGNLVYEVPDNWVVSTSDADTTVSKTYTDGKVSMVVTYMPMELDMSGMDSSIQKLMLNAPMESFEAMDDYTEMSNDYYNFEGNSGNARLFTYDVSGTNVTTMTNVMYTGEGIGMFIMGFPTTLILDVNSDAFLDVMKSTKTVGTSGGEASDTSQAISGTAKEHTRYSADFYKVGTDIPAGEYVVFAESDQGYFCVSSDSNQKDITFNENFAYNSIITIRDGEYLELSRCYAVPLEENPDIALSDSGMFKVGTHIPAGEYKLTATGTSGYYCVYPDSRQDDIIANDNFENQNYVTVSEGQYLVLSRCKFAETPTKPVKSYTDAETVKKVQEALNAAGYDCGTPDGIAGSGTAGQVEKYQMDKGLGVTGTITDEILESLEIN